VDDHQRLLDERHAAVMAAIASIVDRLDILNGRTRASEKEIAVLADRSSRATTISLSTLSAVCAAALYWITHR